MTCPSFAADILRKSFNLSLGEKIVAKPKVPLFEFELLLQFPVI